MKNSINTSLYTLNQENLRNYLKVLLTGRGIKFQEIDGNIISLDHNDAPCFVAHLDTVCDTDMSKPLLVNDKLMMRNNGILGADDRAGVNLIMNHAENINFIFTRDEEIGALGASSLVLNKLEERLKEFNIPCCIELDRHHGDHILGSSHGYCMDDLQAELEKALPLHKNSMGIFTDIDQFIDFIPCCNISVGYYNQHTNNEYLNIEEYNYINDKILELSEIRGTFKTPEPFYKSYSVFDSKYYEDRYGKYNDDDAYGYYKDSRTHSTDPKHYDADECELCQCRHGLEYVWTMSGYLCDECREYLLHELHSIEDERRLNAECSK